MKKVKNKIRQKSGVRATERLALLSSMGSTTNLDLDDHASDGCDQILDFHLDGAPEASNVQRRKSTKMRSKKKPIGYHSKHAAQRRKASKANIVKASLAMLGRSRMSGDTSPEQNDHDAKGLWACNSVDDVQAHIVKGNLSFQKKASKALTRHNVADQLVLCLNGLFTGTTTSSTIMIGDRLRNVAWRQLHTELVALVAQDTEVMLVTIIDGDGATSHTRPIIDLHAAQAAAQKTLRAMSPNFFAVSELAMFNSTPHPDGGQLLQLHTHALIWGEDLELRAREVGAKHMARFTPNATEAPQIDVRSVSGDSVNLARICAYMFKAPHRSMNWCPPRDGKKGFMNQSEKGDRMIRYLRMAMIRAMLTFEDVAFAGGEGQSIRSLMVKNLRTTCGVEAPSHRRLLHPDAISAYCVDLAKALRKNDWSLPVIKRQK